MARPSLTNSSNLPFDQSSSLRFRCSLFVLFKLLRGSRVEQGNSLCSLALDFREGFCSIKGTRNKFGVQLLVIFTISSNLLISSCPLRFFFVGSLSHTLSKPHTTRVWVTMALSSPLSQC
eukprot:sb/3476211/